MTSSKEKGKREGYCIHGNPLDFDCGGCKYDASIPKTESNYLDSMTPEERQEQNELLKNAELTSTHHEDKTGWEGALTELCFKLNQESAARYKDGTNPFISLKMERRLAEFISALILKAKEEGYNKGVAEWYKDEEYDRGKEEERERILAMIDALPDLDILATYKIINAHQLVCAIQEQEKKEASH